MEYGARCPKEAPADMIASGELIGRLSAFFVFSCSATAASDGPASDKK
jgi:hypothetical protein